MSTENNTSFFTVTDLTLKQHGSYLLDHVSISLSKGDTLYIYGFRGSGKSVLLTALSGALKVKGKISLDGATPKFGRKYYKKTGLILEKPTLFQDLNVLENLDLIGSLKGAKDKNIREKIVASLELHEFLKRPVSSLTPDIYARVNVAVALLHEPELLFMDDILYGIDPHSIDLIESLIKDFSNNGGTLIRAMGTPHCITSNVRNAWLEAGKLEFVSEQDICNHFIQKSIPPKEGDI